MQEEILQQAKVVQLSHLQQIYVTALESTPHANPDYRSENLKEKLIKEYGSQLSFCDMGGSGQYQSALISSSAVDVQTAVKQAFLLASKNTLESVGLTLHHVISEKHATSPNLKWPPTPQELDVLTIPT